MCVGNSAHIIVIIGSKCTNKIRLIANSHRWAQGGIGTISGVERVIVRNGAVCILQHDAVVFILPGGRAIVPMLDSRQAGKFIFRLIIVADVIFQHRTNGGHISPLDGGGFPTAGNLAGLGIVGRRCAGNDVHLHGRGGDGRSGRNGGLPHPGDAGVGENLKLYAFRDKLAVHDYEAHKFARARLHPCHREKHIDIHSIVQCNFPSFQNCHANIICFICNLIIVLFYVRIDLI